jgi:aspartokinase/homoserine dehydrogenase 1
MEITVHKIGGILINSRLDIDNLLNNILYKDLNVVIIFSAIGKTTQYLKDLIKIAESSENYRKELLQLKNFHLSFVNEKDSTFDIINLFNELKEYLNAVNLIGKATAPSIDKVLSFGEILAGIIYKEALKTQNKEFSYLDSREIIFTNSDYSNAVVNIKETVKKFNQIESNSKTIIAPGFIASNGNGSTTTMGFESSNLTSILFAIGFKSQKVYWWTDVKGIHQIDPKIYPKSKIISNINYEQAKEIAEQGFKLIPQNLVELAKENKIEITIGNPSFDSQTKISDKEGHNHLILVKKEKIIIIGAILHNLIDLLTKIKYQKVTIEKNKTEITTNIDLINFQVILEFLS